MTRISHGFISPDGRRFLMLKETTAQGNLGGVVIVEHWFEELKRLVPIK